MRLPQFVSDLNRQPGQMSLMKFFARWSKSKVRMTVSCGSKYLCELENFNPDVCSPYLCNNDKLQVFRENFAVIEALTFVGYEIRVTSKHQFFIRLVGGTNFL